MAPEQIEGGEVDGRADVFAVGVLLYESMVGHLPFDGDNPAQVLRRVLETSYREAQKERPSVGSRWSAILDRALARRPEDRFPDATAMREALGAELSRLGMTNPRAELEAWMADAAEYERSHSTRLRDALCALGAAARRNHDSLSAAADYNRALALFPTDPQLLRIVARMNRSNARIRMLRRAVPVVLGIAVVAALPAVVWRVRPAHPDRSHALEPNAASSEPASKSSVVASAEAPMVPSASTISVPSTRTARSPRDVVRMAPIRAAAPARDAAPTPVERALTLDLRPSVGVTVSVDGQPPREVASGESLVLGGDAHSLVFGCPVCNPVQVPVRPSDKDETLHVVVPVRPATLVIVGEPDKAYQIAEMPEIVVRAGENALPLVSMFRVVTVRQIETGEARTIRVKAGDVARVAF
jgi:serine/threonine-protein kinase